MDLKAIVARNLRLLRSAQGLTQEAVADRSGLSARYITKIETGAATPSITVIGQLAEALAVSPEELFHVESKRRAKGKQGPMNDEWFTPQYIIDALGPFDLDPCAPSHESRIAPVTFTKADDGLTQQWFGMVWCNPPYSDPLPFVLKMWLHNAGFLLVRASMETAWMDWALMSTTCVLFPSGRIKFISKDGSASQVANHTNVILAFGKEAAKRLKSAVALNKLQGRLFEPVMPEDEEQEKIQKEYVDWLYELPEEERDAYVLNQVEDIIASGVPERDGPQEILEKLIARRDRKAGLGKA